MRCRPALSGRMGFLDRGKGLVLDLEVTLMWIIPLYVTLRMTKTRRSWSLMLRVRVFL
jgi:hypothetical protein